MPGRAVRVNLPVGGRVSAGDILVELEADAERLARDEARARVAALGPEISAVRQEIAAEERRDADEQQGAVVARNEQRALLRETQATAALADEEARRLARLRADGIMPEVEELGPAPPPSSAAPRPTRPPQRSRGSNSSRRPHESDRLVRIQRLRGTLSRLEGEGSTAAAAVKRLDYDVERRVLRAPIDGRIAEAAELRVGAVVDEGDRLAAIVPEGVLRVVAHFAPASAIGRAPRGPARSRPASRLSVGGVRQRARQRRVGRR